MRSILFLPLDKIERVPKALGSNADKVIFDLEDGLAKDTVSYTHLTLPTMDSV